MCNIQYMLFVYVYIYPDARCTSWLWVYLAFFHQKPLRVFGQLCRFIGSVDVMPKCQVLRELVKSTCTFLDTLSIILDPTHLIPFAYSKDFHKTSIGQTCLTMAEDLVDTDGTPKEGHYIEFGIPVKKTDKTDMPTL